MSERRLERIVPPRSATSEVPRASEHRSGGTTNKKHGSTDKHSLINFNVNITKFDVIRYCCF